MIVGRFRHIRQFLPTIIEVLVGSCDWARLAEPQLFQRSDGDAVRYRDRRPHRVPYQSMIMAVGYRPSSASKDPSSRRFFTVLRNLAASAPSTRR